MWILSGKCRSKARLDGKTAVITGCNTGIGKETVLDFVKRGARVIMACRDLEKAESAAGEIREKTAGSEGAGEVVVTRLDLGSFASVRECAEHLLRTEPKINLLINNAGVMACPRALTEDGFEMQFQVNHLSHFLLTCLLLPRIRQSAPARIVSISSHAYYIGSIDFDDLKWEMNYNPSKAYARSKLANILFTKELAKRLTGTGVTTYAVHPGVVATELGRHLDTALCRGTRWMFDKLAAVVIKTPKQGAQTTIYCAVSNSAGKESGLYYSDCSTFRLLRKARDPEVAQKLWKVSTELVGLGEWDPFISSDHLAMDIPPEKVPENYAT